MKIPSMVAQTTLSTLAFIAISLLSISPALANPTGKEPYRALDAHGTIAAAKGMVANLYQLYEEEEKFVSDTYERRATPVKFSDRRISKSFSRLWKARRDANHLTLMGEPAGSDLYKKLTLLLMEVSKFGTAYRGTPRGVQLVARINQERTRKMPALRKFLERTNLAIERGNLEIVNKQMEAKGIELNEQIAFLNITVANRYYREFAGVLAKNDDLLQRKRKQEYMKHATDVMHQEVVAATEFPAEASRIAGEIAASGSAALGEQKTAAVAEAFAYVANLWGHASAGLLRATAIQWAFTNRARTQVQPSPAELKEIALRSLASIIEAAAVSTPREDVQAAYVEFLKQISIVDRRSGRFSQDVSKACAPALSKLVAKDPALEARIEAYRRATSEVLRWREEYAAQQAKRLVEEFPATTTLLSAKHKITPNIRPNFTRASTRETVTAPSTFGDPASWMVDEAAARLVGKSTSDDLLIRLTPTSRTAVVPFRSHHYGNVPVPLPSEEEVKDLRKALIVDDAHGPLTADSADALSAAELHDYLSVAGLIEEVHVESMVTRFAGLPDIAYPLSSLGTTPPMDTGIEPLQQMLWRLDIKPEWARQKYFMTRVPSSAQ